MFINSNLIAVSANYFVSTPLQKKGSYPNFRPVNFGRSRDVPAGLRSLSVCWVEFQRITNGPSNPQMVAFGSRGVAGILGWSRWVSESRGCGGFGFSGFRGLSYFRWDAAGRWGRGEFRASGRAAMGCAVAAGCGGSRMVATRCDKLYSGALSIFPLIELRSV